MVTSWRERERLERSYWPRDKCTLCKLPDCEECPIFTEEYGELEQEYHKWMKHRTRGCVECLSRIEYIFDNMHRLYQSQEQSGSLKPKPSPVVGKNTEEAQR